MAIIARNSITLTQVIDISTVTWYYKKQSSISSKPAKPTVADPTSLGWSSDEPTYTEGATDSLYICQKTTFSDGSFDYSDVSLSSSYEAAKLAYNRAVAAQNASDELAPELIVGTHGTAATATWTGRSTVLTSIQAGTKIQYKLSSNGGSNVTLNLTLKDGTTTGAKAVYYLNNTRLGTQYTVGAVINLVYDGSYWRVANPYTNSNTTYTTYSNAVKAGANGVKRYTLLMKDSDNTWTSIVNEANNAGVSGKTAYDSEEGFLLSDVVYSAGGAEYAAGGNTSTIVSGSYSVDLRYSSNGLATKAADATSPLTTYVPVYLVGIIDPSNGKFHLQESGWITQTIPTYEDGKTYIHLGEASSIYQVYLSEQNPAYQFYDGKFRKLSDIETTKAQTAADQAQYDIDHLEIGGRNFALKTAREKVPQLQGSSSVKYVYSSEYEVGSKGKSVIQNGYSSSGTNTFTLSFDTVLTTPTTTGVYTVEVAPYLNGTQGNIETDTFDMREGDAYVCHYSSTFEITSAQKSYSGTFGVKVKFTTNRIAVNGMLFHVRNLKLEKGNRKSDWTPAPEDVEESIEVLKTQIDGKVETWATNEDPASGWSSATDKEAHVGDLWYYTGETKDGRTNNTTYCYTKGGTASSPTYSWEVYSNNATDLFDRIDGKKNIFYGAPAVPDATHFVGVADGDYLVDEDGTSYRWDTTVSDANKWVLASSVEVGGRNLASRARIDSYPTDAATENNYVYRLNKTISNAGLKISSDIFTVGEKYVLSFKVKKVSGTFKSLGGHCGAFDKLGFYVDGVYKSNYHSACTMTDDTATHVGVAYLKYNGGTSDNNLYIQPNRSGNEAGVFDIWDIQVETGNKSTDWTPAPEDVDANIQNVSDRVTNRNLLVATGGTQESFLGTDGGDCFTKWFHLSEYAKSILANNVTDDFTISFDYDMGNMEPSGTYTAVQLIAQLNGTSGNILWTPDIEPGSTGHYSYTFKLNATQADASNFRMGVRIRVGRAKEGAFYSISNLKLEQSDHETEWTQAPEDQNYIGIGGDNLILGTGDDDQTDKWVLLRANKVSGGIVRFTPTTSAAYMRTFSDHRPYGRYKDQYYTLSFDARIFDTDEYADIEPNMLAGTAQTLEYTISSGESVYSKYWYFTAEAKEAMTGNTSDYITVTFDYMIYGAGTWTDGAPYLYAQINDGRGNAPLIYVKENDKGHAVCTYKLTEAQANYEYSFKLRIRIRAANGAQMDITHPKIIMGQADTPWRPMPGDDVWSYTDAPKRLYVNPLVMTADRMHQFYMHNSNYDRYGALPVNLIQDYEWHRYHMTFHVPNSLGSGVDTVLVDENYLAIELYLEGSKPPVDIRCIKLERGIQASEWSRDPADITELRQLQESLKKQLDGKILTWAQESNPADKWTSAALKTAHKDDLWYYTGSDSIILTDQSPNIEIINNNTYQWDGSKWAAYAASESLFDRIDGKRAIFYGAPNDSYGTVEENDLLIDTDGTTYKWVVDEQTPANTGWKKASDIEIGGRNLLRNTEYPVGGRDIARSSASNVVTDDGIITITSPSDASAYFCWKTGNIGYADYTPGKLTLSFETMEEDGAEETVSRDIIVRVIARPLSRVDAAGTSSANEKYTPPLTPEGTLTHATWGKRYVTVDVPDDLTSGSGNVFNDGSIITVQISETSNGKPIKLRRFKLEKGNRATDWTPAPEDTQAQIDTLQPELIEGTHGTTATATWTGISQKITALIAGTRIQFKMTSAGVSPVTLNLTLADGTTTGAKSVYFIGTTALGTQYKINAVVDLIYDGEAWRVLNPFTDTTTNYYDRTNYKAALAASEVIAEKKLAVMGEDGKLKVLAASKYDVTCPILYVATAYSAANVTAGTTRTTNYSMWGTPFNLATTKSGFTGAAGKSVYIVGTLSGKWFTPDTEVFTVTEPTTENGKAYMLLGTMSTATNAVLNAEHPVYQYIDGKFQRVDQAALIKVAALDTQTGIFNRLTDNGIVQGLFMEKVNGVNQLFINMSYLKTGILRVGGEAIESILFDGSVTVINNNGYDKKTLGAFHLVNEQRYIVVYDSVSYNLNCEYNDIDEYYYIGDGWLIEDIPTAPPDPQFVIYEDTDGVRIKCTAAGTHTVKLIGYEEKDTFYANADTGEVRINGDFESSNGNYTVSIKNALLDMVYSGNSIGSIGMGAFQFRPNNRGISFDLNAAGDFLAWRVNDGENWNYIMAYTRQAFGSFAANHLTFTENINLTNKAAQYVYNPQSAVDAFGRVAYNGTITINGTVYQVSNGMIFSRT